MFGFWWRRKHNRLQGLLSAYIDAEVSDSDALRVEAHLAECEECRMEMAELRATVGLLRALPQFAAPRSFALREAPASARRTPPIVWTARLSTSVAGLLLVALLLGDALGILTQTPRSEGVQADAAAPAAPAAVEMEAMAAAALRAAPQPEVMAAAATAVPQAAPQPEVMAAVPATPPTEPPAMMAAAAAPAPAARSLPQTETMATAVPAALPTAMPAMIATAPAALPTEPPAMIATAVPAALPTAMPAMIATAPAALPTEAYATMAPADAPTPAAQPARAEGEKARSLPAEESIDEAPTAAMRLPEAAPESGVAEEENTEKDAGGILLPLRELQIGVGALLVALVAASVWLARRRSGWLAGGRKFPRP